MSQEQKRETLMIEEPMSGGQMIVDGNIDERMAGGQMNQ